MPVGWILIFSLCLFSSVCSAPQIPKTALSAHEEIPAEAKVELEKGKKLFPHSEWNAALAALDKAISSAPKFARAYYYRGLVCSQKGQYDKSIEEYSLAITADSHLVCLLSPRAHLRPQGLL